MRKGYGKWGVVREENGSNILPPSLPHLVLENDVLPFPVLDERVVLQCADEVVLGDTRFLAHIYKQENKQSVGGTNSSEDRMQECWWTHIRGRELNTNSLDSGHMTSHMT